MPIAQILALVAFAVREAPEVLHLLVSLVKIVTPDETDAKLDKFDEQAGRILNTLLASARSTASAVQTFDFGKTNFGEQNQARFDDVVRAVKAVASDLGKELSQGEAETIAQNGWALAFRSADGAAPGVPPVTVRVLGAAGDS